MDPTSSSVIEAGPVRVIYSCYGGTHSSPVAAAIHLGRLPRDRVPAREELLSIPGFDRAEGDGRGRLTPVGTDRWGNFVYVLPRGSIPLRALRRLIAGTLAMCGRADMPLVIVDTLVCLNWPMRVGGFLSRRLGLVFVGRPLVAWGTQRAYRCLVALVERVEAALSGPASAAGRGTDGRETGAGKATQRLTWHDRG